MSRKEDPKVTKTIRTTVNTEKFKVEYHEARDEFQLIIDPEIQLADGPLNELRVVLPASVVRQMADLLPPLDPETVH